MAKTIITAALTGAVTPKSLNPDIPLTPKEIAEDAVRVWREGAAIVHLHMRDGEGNGCMDLEKFRETVTRIRETTDLVVNVTTSGGPTPDDESRFVHVQELDPEICTFDAGTFNWLPGPPFMNTAEFLRKLGRVCIETGVKPEIEVFDYGMINAAEYYQKKEKVLPVGSLHFQLCLGVLGQAKAIPGNVTRMIELIPEGSTISGFGIGAGHMPCLYTLIASGAHVRVGLEDNVYYSKGVLATNSMLVARAARCIREYGNEVASPDDARAILSLKSPGK